MRYPGALALAWLTLVGAATGQVREGVETVAFTAGFTELAILAGDGEALESELLIDPADAVDLWFASSSQSVQIALQSPSGAIYASGAADTPTVKSVVLDRSDEAVVHAFRLTDPEPGRWLYRILSPAADEKAAIILTMSTSSALAAGLVGAQSQFPANQEVQLGLAVFDEEGGLPASAITSVEASLSRNGGEPVELVFVDDGQGPDMHADDGLLTASFDPGGVGEYRVFVRLAGVRNGQPFARTVAGGFEVAPECGRFTGGYRSISIDDDGNGRPEGLDIETDIETLRAGRFRLHGLLRAENGNVEFANSFADLEVGPQRMRVGFDAALLRDLGAGPYQVADLKLGLVGDEGIEPCAQYIEVGQTEAFDPAGAERPDILLAGPHRDAAVDGDGDGDFDRLDYDVALDLLVGGEYSWSAGLYDSRGAQVGFASGSGPLAMGASSTTLAFDGRGIAESAVDGPYQVRNYSIVGAFASASFGLVGDTQPYRASEFGAEVGGPGPGGGRPEISAGGAVNAATFEQSFASGAWLTIFGSNLASTIATWDNAIVGDVLPTELEGVRVSINNRPAAVAFVSPGQLNVQAPDDMTIGEVDVQVLVNGVASETVTGELRRFSPGLFAVKPNDVRYAAAVHLDGSFVGPAGLFGGVPATRPAEPGERILLFGTGFGPTSPPAPAGTVFRGAAHLANPVSVLINSRPALTEFAGLSGAGLNQFNVIVPEGLRPGDHEVRIQIGSTGTPSGVFLRVGRAPGGGGEITVKVVNASSSVQAGGFLNQSWTASLQNTSPKTLLIESVLSSDAELTTDDIVLESSVRETEQGQSGVGSTGPVRIPESTPAGQYFYGVVITLGGSGGTRYPSNTLPVTVSR